MTTNQPTVETYQLIASNGRPIRKATKVTFSDGTEIKFLERMGKREAIKQAEAARKAEQHIDRTCKICGMETLWTDRVCTYCKEEAGQSKGEMVASTTNHTLRAVCR